MIRRTSRRRNDSTLTEQLETRALLATITVTSLEDNTTEDGEVTLREAIQAANTNASVDGSEAGDGADAIVFDPSLDKEPITLTRFISVTESVSIEGNGTTNTIIRGGRGFNALQVSRSDADVDLSVSHLKLRRFRHSISHFGFDGTLSVRNVRFRNSQKGIVSTTDLNVIGSEFWQNRTTGNGAGIDATTVSGDRANGLKTVTINSSRFLNNTGSGRNSIGVGVHMRFVNGTVNASLFAGNEATGQLADAAGVAGLDGTFLITNSTFLNNRAEDAAAAIGIRGAARIENNTVVGNHANTMYAAGSSGGIYFVENSEAYLANNVIAGNTVGEGDELINEDLTVRETDIPLVAFSNFIGSAQSSMLEANGGVADENGNMIGSEEEPIDPMLGDLQDHGGPTESMMPLTDSPLLDAGHQTSLGREQRGLPRIAGSAVDIGAVEVADMGFRIVPSRITVSEADGTQTVTFDVALLTASAEPITVNVISQGGTATAGSDYESVDTDLEFTGEMGQRQQFEITILDDDDFELRETVEFVLTSDSSERIAYTRASVQIESDDLSGIAFSAGTLLIGGDDADDVVTITADGDDIVATLNGTSETFAAADIAAARVLLGEGSNQLTMDSDLVLDSTVVSLSGDDTIATGAGNDSIFTDGGNDVVSSGAGDDSIMSGIGSDSINAGAGKDTVFAGAGEDTVNGSDGNDLLAGQQGRDVLAGDGGRDTLLGGGSRDTLSGGTGEDRIFGHTNPSLDTMPGVDANDQITGDEGDDTIFGGEGFDRIDGGAGDDQIEATSGSLHGGDGADRLQVFGDVASRLNGGAGADVAVGGDGDDTLWGGEDADSLFGSGGNDVLMGEAGKDSLRGGAGDDELYGGAKADRLFGEVGDDTIVGGFGNDRAEGNDGDDMLFGNVGRDLLLGGNDHDLLHGGEDSDSIHGQSGNDVVMGGDGADSLTGSVGQDLMLSGMTSHEMDGLKMIMAEWSSERTVLQRRANLIDGSGTEERANGDVFLIDEGTAATVFDDSEIDMVFGQDDTDWFQINDVQDENDGDLF